MKGWYPGGCSFEIWKMSKHNLCMYIYTYLRGKNSHLHICIHIYRDMLLTCMYVGVPTYTTCVSTHRVGLMNWCCRWVDFLIRLQA